MDNVSHRHGVVPDKILVKTAEYYTNKGHEHIAEKINIQRNHHKALLEKQVPQSERKMPPAKILHDGQVVKIYSMGRGTNFNNADLKRDSTFPSIDKDVNHAYEGTKATYEFFKETFGIKSINNKGFDLLGYVHYDEGYNNAYWDGEKMVFGDGDRKIFNSFTKDIDISAHEQSHGLTDRLAGTKTTNDGSSTGINYEGQSGGINEGYSDIFGISVKQWKHEESPTESNWQIGEKLIIPKKGRTYALRNMLRPGSGFINHPALGTDTQISHWAEYQSRQDQHLEIDPHDSSGIVNKAFATASMEYHGDTKGAIVKIFFHTLPHVVADETFAGLAGKTLSVAKSDFSSDVDIQKALMTGWRDVGVIL